MPYAIRPPGAGGNTLVGIGDGGNLDSFSRLRTSDPHTVFDSRFEYQLGASNWGTYTVGGSSAVTHLPLESSASLTIGTGATDSCYRQTLRYFRYQPGKSQLVFLTGVMGAAVANVRKRVGYFDAANGIFLEQNGTTDVAITRRTSVSGSPSDAARVVQSAWNLDTLSGAGGTANPSGFTLNLANGYILVIDLQWLGYGRVRVGFDIGGQIVYVHEFLNANVLTTVYMTTATLPVRYEIANTAGSAGASMTQTCTAVVSEGGDEEVSGFEFGASNGITAVSVTTRRAILTIRPTATFNSIANHIHYSMLDHYTLCGGANVLMELVYNPTFSGTPVWAAVDAYSSMEFSVHADAALGAITNGYPIAEWYVPAGSGISREALAAGVNSSYPLAVDVDGGKRSLSLVATSFSGTATVSGALNFREVR